MHNFFSNSHQYVCVWNFLLLFFSLPGACHDASWRSASWRALACFYLTYLIFWLVFFTCEKRVGNILYMSERPHGDPPFTYHGNGCISIFWQSEKAINIFQSHSAEETLMVLRRRSLCRLWTVFPHTRPTHPPIHPPTSARSQKRPDALLGMLIPGWLRPEESPQDDALSGQCEKCQRMNS